jgi:hypothetical protein
VAVRELGTIPSRSNLKRVIAAAGQPMDDRNEQKARPS